MKQFACGDVVPECSARFTHATEEEVLRAVAVHARDDHGMHEVPPELVEQVRAKIVDA